MVSQMNAACGKTPKFLPCIGTLTNCTFWFPTHMEPSVEAQSSSMRVTLPRARVHCGKS